VGFFGEALARRSIKFTKFFKVYRVSIKVDKTDKLAPCDLTTTLTPRMLVPAPQLSLGAITNLSLSRYFLTVFVAAIPSNPC
jgi:hypothetical protein